MPSFSIANDGSTLAKWRCKKSHYSLKKGPEGPFCSPPPTLTFWANVFLLVSQCRSYQPHPHCIFRPGSSIPSRRSVKGQKIFPSDLQSWGNVVFLAKAAFFSPLLFISDFFRQRRRHWALLTWFVCLLAELEVNPSEGELLPIFYSIMGEKGPFQMGNPECSGFGGYSGTKTSPLCLHITIYYYLLLSIFINCFFFFKECSRITTSK